VQQLARLGLERADKRGVGGAQGGMESLVGGGCDVRLNSRDGMKTEEEREGVEKPVPKTAGCKDRKASPCNPQGPTV